MCVFVLKIFNCFVFFLQGIIFKIFIMNFNVWVFGDDFFYQLYFVCIIEFEKSIFIEYGKSLGILDSGDIYLNMIDIQNFINVCFYVFGNDENFVKIMDVYLVLCLLMMVECKGDIVKDMEINFCVQKCYKDCDFLVGNIEGVLL